MAIWIHWFSAIYFWLVPLKWEVGLQCFGDIIREWRWYSKPWNCGEPTKPCWGSMEWLFQRSMLCTAWSLVFCWVIPENPGAVLTVSRTCTLKKWKPSWMLQRVRFSHELCRQSGPSRPGTCDQPVRSSELCEIAGLVFSAHFCGSYNGFNGCVW